MEIKDFSSYYLDDDRNIIRKKDSKVVSITTSPKGYRYCKLKNDNGSWCSVQESTVFSLSSIDIDLTGFKEIPNSNGLYFINKIGTVISFASIKSGIILKPYYYKCGKKYPIVTINNKTETIHSLIAKTFINKNYVEEGLCCMHIDNDKNNHTLSNLKIGTYSENNKQAYEDGVNPGKSNFANI